MVKVLQYDFAWNFQSRVAKCVFQHPENINQVNYVFFAKLSFQMELPTQTQLHVGVEVNKDYLQYFKPIPPEQQFEKVNIQNIG